jgi:hypothetical protein
LNTLSLQAALEETQVTAEVLERVVTEQTSHHPPELQRLKHREEVVLLKQL